MEEIAVREIPHPLFRTVERFLHQLDIYERSSTLIPCQYMVQLVFLAELNLERFRGVSVKHCYHDPHCFDSLHYYRNSNLIARVREKIRNDEIPHDWLWRLIEAMG